MEKVSFRVDSPNHGISALFYAEFDKALRAMEKEGYHLISLAENLTLRIRDFETHSRWLENLRRNGQNANLTYFMPASVLHGNRVSEAAIYVPGDGRYITRNSPAMKRPEEFVAAEKARRPFYITKSELEEALSDSVKFPYAFDGEIPKGDFEGGFDNKLPLDIFEESDVIKFCFCNEDLKKYRGVLEPFGIKNVSISLNGEKYVNAQEQPFAKQLSFGGIGNGSPIWTIDESIRGYFVQDHVGRTVELDAA